MIRTLLTLHHRSGDLESQHMTPLFDSQLHHRSGDLEIIYWSAVL